MPNEEEPAGVIAWFPRGDHLSASVEGKAHPGLNLMELVPKVLLYQTNLLSREPVPPFGCFRRPLRCRMPAIAWQSGACSPQHEEPQSMSISPHCSAQLGT